MGNLIAICILIFVFVSFFSSLSMSGTERSKEELKLIRKLKQNKKYKNSPDDPRGKV